MKLFKCSTIGPALTRYYVIPHVKLHRIHSSDVEFHTHPWNAVSLIFGSYKEHLQDGRVVKRFGFHYLPARRPHKIEVSKPVWTLFFNGKRINEHWTYGSVVKPWEGSDQERLTG